MVRQVAGIDIAREAEVSEQIPARQPAAEKLQDNEPGVEVRGTEGLMSNLEGNKQVVVDYYQTAFNGNPEKAVADHFGPRYIQHNPEAQDGPEAFIGFVRWLQGQYPNLQLDIKRVIAEGDMVVTHSHLDLEPGNPDNPGRALADFFRVENGKVVEHWDVIQEIPATSANNNGMF